MEEYLFWCESCHNGRKAYWISFADPVPEEEEPRICPFCGSKAEKIDSFLRRIKVPEKLEMIGALTMAGGRK